VEKRVYRSPRRDLAATQTRHAILDAAAELFGTRGYAPTTVAQVAEAAEVATNTVYTSIGGKPQLVVALTERAVADPTVGQTMDKVEAAGSAAEILRATAKGTADTCRHHLRLIIMLYENTHADPMIAEAGRFADRLYRERLDQVTDRLIAVGGLRPGLDRAEIRDVLWFYFGRISWVALRELGWSWARGQRWLTEQASAALCAQPA
jgi:AcrR family transcriptional regulator